MSTEQNQTPSPSSQESALVGTNIAGRYLVLRSLGAGGMGGVYLTRDTLKDNLLVAVKLLHPELSRDQKYTQRFLREIQLTQKVSHSNVVQLFDYGQHGETLYFSMEYIPGKTLEQLILKRSLTKEQLPQIIIGIGSGLEAIHKAGIIHRDLKPGNIIVTAENLAKIADFGVARPQHSELTSINEIVGSTLYMAPEIWMGKQVTGSVDLYSLGIILYQATTAHSPFRADSTAEMMRLHLERHPTPPVELNASIPAWLNKLILKLLSKSPAERFHDARELVDYVLLHAAPSNQDNSEDITKDSRAFIEQLEKLTSSSTELSAVSKQIDRKTPGTPKRIRTVTKNYRMLSRKTPKISYIAVTYILLPVIIFLSVTISLLVLWKVI